MAVKGSGALSILNDIVAEFGGDAPHSLSEYYGGGDYVPAGANPGIATSGQINMGSHYSAVAATVLNITSNVNNYDIGAALAAVGGSKTDGVPVIVDISPGVTVSSTSTATPAMLTGTGWSSGASITIINNGSILGASGSYGSGAGGNGGGGSSGAGGNGGAGTSGGGLAGGDGFEHSQTADNNLSVIFDVGVATAGAGGTGYGTGGGGGGGGGAGMCGFMFPVYGGAGGGGAGSPGGSGCNAGTTSAGGAGCSAQGGNGAAGGGIASAGGTGGGAGPGFCSPAYPTGGVGGAGGATQTSTGAAGSAYSGNTAQIS